MLSAGTVALLFQPWMTASGPGGTIRSDGFGALRADGGIRDSWAGSGIPTVEVGGAWGVLTCLAALAAIFATVAYLCTRTPLFAHVTAVAGASVAVFVLADALYLNGKEWELRTAVDDSGVSGLVGNLLGHAGTDNQLAAAHLEIAVLLAGVTAVAAAVSALMNYQPTVAAERSATPVLPPVAEPAEATPPVPAAPAHVHLSVPVMPEPDVDGPEPAYRVLEPAVSATAKDPSWRIVIPAAEVYGQTAGVRTIARATR